MVLTSRARVAGSIAAVSLAVGIGLAAIVEPAEARSPTALAGSDAPSICRGGDGRLGRSPELLVLAREIARDGTLLAQNDDIEDNLDVFEKLGLLEGHLIVGMALLEAKMTADALPHFGHPVQELYEYLEPMFKKRNVADFKADLEALEAMAKATPPDPRLADAYAGVLRKVDGLRATIPASMLNSRAFMIRAVALMMRNAADDLGESIEKGRIANTLEYHDALGFARYTAAVVEARAALLGNDAPRIAGEMKVVMAAFPSLAPPERPARSAADLEAASDRVKALAP